MLHQLFIQLYINNKLFIDLIENICKKHNINHLQLYIIILSSYEKITKSAISQAIVGLSIRRLIVKVQSKEDKKVFYITPTNKAEKMKREIVSLCEDKYQIFEEKMGKEDMMMFIDLIVKFNNILEELKNYKEGKKC